MPELTAILLAEQYRARLLSGERQSAVRLVNAYGMIYGRLQARMDALNAELDALMSKGQLHVWDLGNLDTIAAKFKAAERRSMAYDQMVALRRQLLDELGRFVVLLEDSIDQGARAAIITAQTEAKALMAAALPGVADLDAAIMAQWQRMDPAAVESMIGFLQEDSPLRKGIRKNLAPAIADQVEQGLIESVALGYSPRTLAARFAKELGTGLNWSLTTARTAQIYAYRESTRAAYIANREIVPQWRWKAAKDTRTCGSCLNMDSTLHDAEERLNDHFSGRCLTPGTLVSGPVAVAFVSRHYDGEVVTIRTASGQLLTVTPNHPILTDRGWVAAGLLKEGDNVIRYSGTDWAATGMSPNEYQVPTRVEDIARAFVASAKVGSVSMPTAPEDFHGDGIGSEVHVISANSLLGHSLDGTIQQPPCQHLFSTGLAEDGALPSCSPLHHLVVGSNASLGDSVASTHEKAVLFGCSRACLQTVSSGLAATISARNPEPYSDDVPGDPQSLSNAVLGLAGDVGVSDSLNVKGQLGPTCRPDLSTNSCPSLGRECFDSERCTFSIVADSNPAINEQCTYGSAGCVERMSECHEAFACSVTSDGFIGPRGDRLGKASPAVEDIDALAGDVIPEHIVTDMQIGADVAEALACQVSLDRVAELRRAHFSGHVYNLQTKVGWYISNNIITHNCTMLPVPIGYEALGIKNVPPAPSTDTYLRGLSTNEQRKALGRSYDSWKSGEIRFDENAREWFQRQPEAAQIAQLGRGKYEALKAGKIRLEQLTAVVDNATWGPMRVEQSLKALVGEAAR